MDLSENNSKCLKFLKDIYEVSSEAETKTYIWGGLISDVAEGGFLREHGDIDGFTVDMMNKLHVLKTIYTERGYLVEFNSEFNILKISMNGLHATFNPLDIDENVAMWRHIGNQGTVFFPSEWLDMEPRRFCDINVYTAGILFDYGFRSIAGRCNPSWKEREKDKMAMAYLKEKIEGMGMDSSTILGKIWSYNPFWAKRGYDPFKDPVLVVPETGKQGEESCGL
ncbi:MAG: hypothetical protein JXB33_10825 [Clostridia bacterium]|nr:hypothetical protein [Clostridia bacterium]